MVVQTTNTQWVYRFSEGDATMRDLLGGKGAGLAEMSRAGLPVPLGFTITTQACLRYASESQFPDHMWEQAMDALKDVETATGRGFGATTSPLLVSVRSGAKFSMPGMMDTVLNLGLCESTLPGLIADTQNERFAYDAYRRFVQMFGKVVLEIDAELFEARLHHAKEQAGVAQDTELTAADLQALLGEFFAVVESQTGKPFPQDPLVQLRLAIEAVFRSWNNPRAIAYRDYNKISHDLGTAVNVQAMVFGNMGDDSGSGVAFTRNPSTGDAELFGEILFNAQGEDVVAGIRTPKKIAELKTEMPEIYEQFRQIAQRLEQHYRDAQDLEFTIERGRLYMLQTRGAKRTADAAVKMAVEMANEGLITREEALLRVEPDQVAQLLLPRFDDVAKIKAITDGQLLAKGLNASPGAASGRAALDADTAVKWAEAGKTVVLVRPETNPDDVHGMIAAQGVLTARGGATSHAAVVARGLGKPCVAGTETVVIDLQTRTFGTPGRRYNEGDEISIDGATGEVFIGAIPTVERAFDDLADLRTLLSWADDVKRLQVWANADYPRDAERAVAFGAQGIGLCRTEHMFFEEDRLPIVRKMILHAHLAQPKIDALDDLTGDDRERAAAALATDPEVTAYREALEALQVMQTSDFRGILKAMAGRPTIIRLLDPPLHEFLPHQEELLVRIRELATAPGNDDILTEARRTLESVQLLSESNPMLGLRGCRLGILYPAIYEMQVRAIFSAAADLVKQGVSVHPEIMIPLIGHVNELVTVRKKLEAQVALIDTPVPYKFGTMIEVPRAALLADEIAEYAEFFSFGTNDLTQMTMALSRDDAEGKFLLTYIDRKILADNPFQTLDQKGVGKLIEIATKLGRSTKPDLEIGICGEHGGDPRSIEFCHRAGLNYVSCSPFRVPVARLAAAHAALQQTERDR